MKNKVDIYYTVKKAHGEGVPNQRIFFISRWHGLPFWANDIGVGGNSWESQKERAAGILGLEVRHCTFHPHRGSQLPKKSSTGQQFTFKHPDHR
jgi:hypothetical protein